MSTFNNDNYEYSSYEYKQAEFSSYDTYEYTVRLKPKEEVKRNKEVLKKISKSKNITKWKNIEYTCTICKKKFKLIYKDQGSHVLAKATYNRFNRILCEDCRALEWCKYIGWYCIKCELSSICFLHKRHNVEKSKIRKCWTLEHLVEKNKKYLKKYIGTLDFIKVFKDAKISKQTQGPNRVRTPRPHYRIGSKGTQQVNKKRLEI